jgi:glycosyltransferase involved in cell wall biosynthesis
MAGKVTLSVKLFRRCQMTDKPTFAFVTVGTGSYLGSTVHDLTLANELHRRGFKVAIYWMLEWMPELADRGIKQRLLCHGTRYRFRRPSEFMDRVIGTIVFLAPLSLRVRFTQRSNGLVDHMLENLIRVLHETPEADRGLVNRLRCYLAKDQVSHLMMSFASIGALALAAKRKGGHSFDYSLTFQGDEQFADYARRGGVLQEYLARLNEVIEGSRWPAMVLSHDYLDRIATEMGVPVERLRVVYPGVEFPERPHKIPLSVLKSIFPRLVEGIPIVSYLGRQEAEKGVDLLLYAAKLLNARGLPLQLVVCGATAKGESYKKVIADLADHLRVQIHHAGAVSAEIRNALFAHSRCVVYPSVNREPFGLVVAEAMSQGTPVVVPDYGGVTEVIRHGDKAGGLTFNTWDSGDLARQLERLLVDEVLYRELAENTRAVAERFTAERMTDCVLDHLGIREGTESA